MIDSKQRYLLFRGDYSGKCIITRMHVSSIQYEFSQNAWQDVGINLTIQCNSANDAIECVYKIQNNCLNILSIRTSDFIYDEAVNVEVSFNFQLGLDSKLSNYFPQCFKIFDISEEVDKYSLECLFELDDTL